MSQVPYRNPISPVVVNSTVSVNRQSTIGTNFSILSVGGYQEVYNISDLFYTIPTGTYGYINYSGNSIPINFLKGSGTTSSIDILTLNSDNISSGRRKLGMLVYVYETDQIYQFNINNYDSLWSAATATTGTVTINNFGTIVRGDTLQGLAFISGWTGNTVEGVSGVTRSTAVWKKLTTGGGGGIINTTGITSSQTLTWDMTYWGISGSSNVDLILPSTTLKDGYHIIIKDEAGICGTYRIRLTPASGLIDGNNYVDMNINYMSLTCMVRDGNWYLI